MARFCEVVVGGVRRVCREEHGAGAAVRGVRQGVEGLGLVARPPLNAELAGPQIARGLEEGIAIRRVPPGERQLPGEVAGAHRLQAPEVAARRRADRGPHLRVAVAADVRREPVVQGDFVPVGLPERDALRLARDALQGQGRERLDASRVTVDNRKADGPRLVGHELAERRGRRRRPAQRGADGGAAPRERARPRGARGQDGGRARGPGRVRPGARRRDRAAAGGRGARRRAAGLPARGRARREQGGRAAGARGRAPGDVRRRGRAQGRRGRGGRAARPRAPVQLGPADAREAEDLPRRARAAAAPGRPRAVGAPRFHE